MNKKERCRLFERLYRRIKHIPSTGCWEWQGACSSYGYGQIRINKVALYTHRIAWELANGPLPKGICVCHTCDNPKCVYVGHLWIGTKEENNRDMAEKGRAIRVPCTRGKRNGMTKLTESQVLSIRRDNRTNTTVAAEYGCNRTNIYSIKTRRSWAWLNEPNLG